MFFLIEYDRTSGRLLSFRSFEDNARHQATECRLDLELRLNRAGIEREVVLLEAASEDDLRRTHRRYFEDLGTLLSVPVGSDDQSGPSGHPRSNDG